MCLLVLWACGCKTIPQDSYGVDRIRFRGMETLDPEALRACLATQERPRVTVSFGTSADPACGVPPFDGNRFSFDMWRKLRKGWPVYDTAVFERDLQRIERWYHARGYYDSAVVATALDPAAAATSDKISVGPDGQAPCEREDENEGCKLEIDIEIEEGQPVIVESIQFAGTRQLKPNIEKRVKDAVDLKVGSVFDEALYERGKRQMRFELQEDGFACGNVSGRVEIDRDKHKAYVLFDLGTGPDCTIGDVTVTGNGKLPADTIRAVASVKTGQPFKASKLADAQRAVYALGGLAAVNISDTPRLDAAGNCTGIVDVNIDVEPGRPIRWGIGVGVQSGQLYTLTLEQDTRISDVHLYGLFEHRNLGGFRRLRIEDRPKIVAEDPFFRFGRGFLLGNEVRVSYQRPAFIEPRTVAALRFRHDWGPDPFELFRRHDLQMSGQLSRPFLDGRLLLSGGLNYDLYFVIDNDDARYPKSYRVLFVDERVTVDLRDDSRSPRKGGYITVGSQQSPFQLDRSWRYVRVTPEARVYAPLPFESTLAFKFGIGAMFIFSRDQDNLDLTSQALGPQLYRLRSGGPTSHRGFFPGFLGDPGNLDSLTRDGRDARNDGGLRRWEASIEWRVPVTSNFSQVFFMDFGDVNRGEQFRFDYIRAAAGFGFRYKTPIGPVRLDFGFLIPKWQIVDAPPQPSSFHIFQFIRGGVPGAISFTIGEAF